MPPATAALVRREKPGDDAISNHGKKMHSDEQNLMLEEGKALSQWETPNV